VAAPYLVLFVDDPAETGEQTVGAFPDPRAGSRDIPEPQ
jgi:hypothetical protein